MKAGMSLRGCLILGVLGLILSGCHAPPHQETSRFLAEVRGTPQAWFEKNWGKPNAKSKRFFGGETWAYFHLPGDMASLLFFNSLAAECQIRLDFNKEGTLEDSKYFGC